MKTLAQLLLAVAIAGILVSCASTAPARSQHSDAITDGPAKADGPFGPGLSVGGFAEMSVGTGF